MSLIDCIRLKIYIEANNLISGTFNSINSSAINIHTNSNVHFTNKSNKTKPVISQINLKISKRNINNKALLKGPPVKTNYEISLNRKNPIKKDIVNNSIIKYNNLNFHSFNKKW